MEWKKDPQNGVKETEEKGGKLGMIERNDLTDLETIEGAKGYVAKARKKMGILARYSFDRQTEKELSAVAGEIAVNYLNAQKTVMVDKIRGTVAIEKRANLREFLQVAVSQDNELRTISDSAEKEMKNLMEVEVMQILKEKKKSVDATKEALQNEEILQDDYEAAIQMHSTVAESLILNKFDRMTKISDGYIEMFQKALEIYRERGVEYKSKMI